MKIARVLSSVLFAATVALGCSDEEKADAAIGQACSGSQPCVAGASCDARGFCTRSCADHDDCGCPAGTTNSDIAASACGVACISGSCVKVCRSAGECPGTTTCQSGEAFDTCR